MVLNETEKKQILDAVEHLFGETKAKLLGRFFEGPRLFFSTAMNANPMATIEGMYRYAFHTVSPTGSPDEGMIKSLTDITSKYIEAQKLRTINNIHVSMVGAKDKEEFFASFHEQIQRSTAYMNLLVATETGFAQAFGTKNGIETVAASIKDERPIVCWRGVIDHRICKYCKKMYHLYPDAGENYKMLAIPKAFYLDEMQGGYFKAKIWDGFSPYAKAHPRCRHSLSYIPKNFGFDDKGMLVFKYLGYNVVEDQRGIGKTEMIFHSAPSWDIDSFIADAYELDPHQDKCTCCH